MDESCTEIRSVAVTTNFYTDPPPCMRDCQQLTSKRMVMQASDEESAVSPIPPLSSLLQVRLKADIHVAETSECEIFL